jgi:protein TonB
MTSAFASAGYPFEELEFCPRVYDHPALLQGGAQSLLVPKQGRPSYLIFGAAFVIYALVMGVMATRMATPAPTVQDDALELVMLPPAVPEEKPPVEEPPPPIPDVTPPETLEAPPPPVAEEPAVAPIEPKPVQKPLPKPKAVPPKPVAQKPREVPHAVEQTQAAPANVPPNAIASGYANQVFARISRAAAGSAPRGALGRPETGRVGYHIVISPSGALVSQSLTSSGNAAVDAAAKIALARAAPFPATGMTRPAAISGAIVFR